MEWIEEWSEEYSCIYWYNIKTGETVFQKPIVRNSPRKHKGKRQNGEKKKTKQPTKFDWKTLSGPEKESRDKEVLKFAEMILESAKMKRQWEEPNPYKELQRYRLASDLRRFLEELCKSRSIVPPSYSFERWVLGQRLIDSGASDPLLPNNTTIINYGLVHEFERAGLSNAESIQICEDLADECVKSIAILESSLETDPAYYHIDLIETDNEITIIFQNQSFQINSKHYRKLCRLYSQSSDIANESLFRIRLFCLLCRYSALDGAGYQAALPLKVFDGLSTYLSVNHECFASPLNCYFNSFGSAFYDVDRHFGSKGSFFEFEPQNGYYEVNPPFVEEVMVAMAMHVENLLNKTNDELGFVIVVPGWTDTPSYDIIKKSRFLREEMVLQPYDHYYMEGFQHNLKRQEKKAQCTTFVFFMQTEKAKEVPKELLDHLNIYFRV